MNLVDQKKIVDEPDDQKKIVDEPGWQKKLRIRWTWENVKWLLVK